MLSGGAERGLEAVGGGSGGPSVGHPLVVESGVAKFAGAVNASVVAHGGESQRYVSLFIGCSVVHSTTPRTD